MSPMNRSSLHAFAAHFYLHLYAKAREDVGVTS